jgi:hypothetical protein
MKKIKLLIVFVFMTIVSFGQIIRPGDPTGASADSSSVKYETDSLVVNTHSSGIISIDTTAGKISIGEITGTPGQYSTIIGDNYLLEPMTKLTYIGYQAGFGTSTKDSANIAIGYQAFKDVGDDSYHNIIIGDKAGYNLGGTNRKNIMIGYQVANNTEGSVEDNVIIGNQAAAGANDDCDQNVIIGNQAADSGFDGEGNVILGSLAGHTVTAEDTDNNVFIGSWAGTSSNADNNVYIGNRAGYRMDNFTGSNNIAIGYYAHEGGVVSKTDSYSVYIGSEAGRDANVNRTIGIGYQAGQNVFSGYDDCINIGYQAGKGNATANQLIIKQANLNATPIIQGDLSTLALTFGGNVSISSLLIKSTTAGITASTTQSQGEQPLTTDINEVSTVANANDVVTMPSAQAGIQIVVINNGANTLQIFPASGDNLGAGVNTSVTLNQGSNVMYVAYNDTNWEQL